jgi:RNAse (barnase) inhibitor barstar
MTSIYINFESISTSEELHLLLIEKFSLPECYEMCWIAFWNYISERIKMPDYIEIEGWMHLRETLPDESEMFLKCLMDYNDLADLKSVKVYIK